MSKHLSLKFHEPEEQLEISVGDSLRPVPAGAHLNPIADYFDATARLKGKILSASYSDDAELLGLMIIGVISSAEFYFRSILGRMIQICPLCARQAEPTQVPIGAINYYKDSDYGFALGAMEHESLADSSKVSSYITKLTGFKINDDSSVIAALRGYDSLCELRHCLAHARGFVGLKGCRSMGLEQRLLTKVLIEQGKALELLKISHNAVRAVNRFLLDSTVNRWIDKNVLTGLWPMDKGLFESVWKTFSIDGEDDFNGNARTAYTPIRRIIIKRQQAIAANA